jgi:hypothetical protein
MNTTNHVISSDGTTIAFDQLGEGATGHPAVRRVD